MSDKFPGNADMADPVSILQEPLVWNPVKHCDMIESTGHFRHKQVGSHSQAILSSRAILSK